MINAGREDVAQDHAMYRARHPEEFQAVTWIPIKKAAVYLDLTPRAVYKRIVLNQWPPGHADLRVIPLQPRPAWFVTEQSLTKM